MPMGREERIYPAKNFGRNRAGPKLSLSNSTSKHYNLQNQPFPVDPIHIYNKFKLNVIYSLHSGEGIHFISAQTKFFRDYLASAMAADVFGVI